MTYQVGVGEQSLLDVLSEIPDFRKARGKRHPLAAILAMACAATLCGYRGYCTMAEWGRNYGKELASELGFKDGKTPCSTTLYTIFTNIDSDLLETKLGEWAERVLSTLPAEEGEECLEGVAMDGKTLRGSRKQGANCTHLLSAVSHRFGLTLGQEAVDEKTNEIPVTQTLLKNLILKGRVFTMDALLTQREIAQNIVDGEGDYIMIAKENQPNLLRDIKDVFTEPQLLADTMAEAHTLDAGHGRIEKRHIITSTALVDFSDWPGLHQVFQLTRTVIQKKSGKRTSEIVYGLSSLDPVNGTPEAISSSVGIGGNKEDEAILEKKPSRNQPTMPQRNCNLSQEKELKSGRTITLPIEESTYEEMLSDSRIFRTEVDHYAEQWPELFPAEIRSGYHLHGKRGSKKLDGFEMQRIKLIEPDEAGKSIVLSIKPSAVMPYMTGYTDEVEKAHYLRQYGVPYSGLTYVFGRSDSYWYRQTTHLGRYSLVQTTIQQPENLPEDLLADEKHSRLLGQKCYIATTVGNDCVLGASVATAADEVALTEAYQTFKEEALHFCPEYQPKTVNTDGWTATQNSWRALFPMIVLIECILHAFISIRSRCKKKFSQAWPELQKKFWDVYDSPTKALFLSSLTDFQTWAATSLSGTALEAVNRLSNKSTIFAKWYQHPTARRTSNMVDRHMEPMERHLNSTKYFHGHLISAEKSIRAWALLHNFAPYCQRSYASEQWSSPAHKLNGSVYHDNWLHNLLVSTSNSPVIILSHQFRQN